MKKLRILGAGVRATLVVDLVAWQLGHELEVEGFYDDRRAKGSPGPGGRPVLGDIAQALAELPGSDAWAFVALGLNASAKGYEVLRQLQRVGARLASLVAPGAHVSPSASIGVNALVFPGVFVGCQARLGDLVCLHGGVVVEHHDVIGSNVHFGPGATLCGSVKIASHAYLGAGCRVIPERTVGVGTLVGAGAVVVKDLPDSVVATGSPARVLRATRAGDEVPHAQQLVELAKLEVTP